MAHISRGIFVEEQREKWFLKPIWHIYVDKLFKRITALSINMFVCWNRIVTGFTSSCLITLWLWKTVLLQMVMREKRWKYKGGIFYLVFCSCLSLPWKSTFHFCKQALKSCFFSKASLYNLLFSPSGNKSILKKKKQKGKREMDFYKCFGWAYVEMSP